MWCCWTCRTQSTSSTLTCLPERIVSLFKKVWPDAWGPRMGDLLANAAHVLFLNPGTTLADLGTLLTDASFRARLLRQVTDEHVLQYFHQEYGPLSDSAQRTIYGPVMNKVRDFLRHPLTGFVVSHSGTTV